MCFSMNTGTAIWVAIFVVLVSGAAGIVLRRRNKVSGPNLVCMALHRRLTGVLV
jgi:LPXTG-motif cell wall-anchored protein